MTITTTNFELIGEREIPELNSRARLYRHSKTGAELLSVENDDENKVFGITFRTPPGDSTGVAHILEHSVLCGSRKYPLKEPFVEMLKGSLKTFLNAFTFPDKTCYPVASQNTQDFYNLIDVYLDAVFYPRITPEIFAQEGWHYELEDINAPLIYKGVVFNEMKGAYGSPERVLGEYAQQSLFPNNTYGVDSGGHPRNIPDLTYEQFKQFHETLYHPSNARIFFSGDDDPETRLRLIDGYLQEFERLEVDSTVPLQPHFDKPQRGIRSYRVDQDSPESKKGYMTVNWLVGETSDPERVMALTILEHILIGTPGAPLRKALLDSGLGEDLAASGFEAMLRQGLFSVGLKGIAMENTDRIEALVFETLNSLVEQGIPREAIEASLNTIEFRLRENNTGSFPRGLMTMIRALITWLHEGDPFAMLAFEAPLQAIKERLAAGEPYFETLLRDSFLNNTHRTTTILQPDMELGKQEEAREQERLQEARAAMTESELQAVVDYTRLLKEMQVAPDPPEALAALPTLTLDDLDKQNKLIPLEVLEQQSTRVLYHDLPTSGITYLDVGLNLHLLPQELLPYAPLFGRALLEMGTTKEDYVRLSQRIGRKTGGISTSKVGAWNNRMQEGALWLFLRGKATQEQNADLLAILQDILLTVELNNKDRFRQIVQEARARKETAITTSGHSFVASRLYACFNEIDWAEEQMGGVSSLFFLRNLLQEIDRDWPLVRERLEQIRRILVNRSAMVCNVTMEQEHWNQFAPRLDSFLTALPTAPATEAQWTPTCGSGFEGLTIPVQVNYVGKGTNLYDLGYTYHGSAAVITRYLRTSWLWERVRVQGGAYGIFCPFGRRSGLFSYLSYRDPNLLGTLDVYDRTGQFLREADLSKSEVERSIIGAIGEIDSYQLPDAKGYTSMVRYLMNESDEEHQQIRDEVLATTAEHFRAFADLLDQVKERGIVVVLGSGDAITKANAEMGGKLQRIDVL